MVDDEGQKGGGKEAGIKASAAGACFIAAIAGGRNKLTATSVVAPAHASCHVIYMCVSLVHRITQVNSIFTHITYHIPGIQGIFDLQLTPSGLQPCFRPTAITLGENLGIVFVCSRNTLVLQLQFH